MAKTIVFPVSRLVVDPERFLKDEEEPMSERGMGAVYTRTSDGRDLRAHLSAGARASLIHKYYAPHHAGLDRAARECLARHGVCLIIDCHSFPSHLLPCEIDQSPDRPDICLGTDLFHSPEGLISEATPLFRGHGFRVMLNRPFSGALVPGSFYKKAASIWALMIEVNRSLYMDDKSGERLPEFTDFAGRLQGIVRSLINLARENIPIHAGR